jgi:hypothetical protein
MENQTDHVPEETLEKFAMGKLPESEAAPLEEHLLTCHACQDRLEHIDTFIHAAKTATAKLKLQHEPSLGERLRAFVSVPHRGVLAMGLAAVCVALIVVPSRTPDTQSVELSASRGPDIGAPQIKGGSPVTLSLDLTEVPASPVYTVELVNSSGSLIWEGKIEPSGNRLTAAVPEQLSSGRYWVRLYGNSLKTDLLREYPLSVK